MVSELEFLGDFVLTVLKELVADIEFVFDGIEEAVIVAVLNIVPEFNVVLVIVVEALLVLEAAGLRVLLTELVLVLLLDALLVIVAELDDDLLDIVDLELVLVLVFTLEYDTELVGLIVGNEFPDFVIVTVPENELNLPVSDTVDDTVDVFDPVAVRVVVGVPELVLVTLLVPDILIVIFGVLVIKIDWVIFAELDGVFEGNPVLLKVPELDDVLLCVVDAVIVLVLKEDAEFVPELEVVLVALIVRVAEPEPEAVLDEVVVAVVVNVIWIDFVSGGLLEADAEAVGVLEGLIELVILGLAELVLDPGAERLCVGLEEDVLEMVAEDVPVFELVDVLETEEEEVDVFVLNEEIEGKGEEELDLETVEDLVVVCVAVIVFVLVPEGVIKLVG